ncbi:helix-turn-helix domain-containing protein [Embleya sp. NPDC020630]|uniref:helix-turn-helix domain-containing protein n=1 Tax=Embleya sp. NPDC020630 TaxID=3363979 RepID=UPI0037AD72E8
MTASTTPMLAKKRLGEALRALRKTRGLTGGEAAELVGWTDSKISRIETAESGVSLYDLEQLLDLYETASAQRVDVLKLHRSSKAKQWSTHAPYAGVLTANYQSLIAYEAECAEQWAYETCIWPGLLQTPKYAHAVISSGPLVQDYDDIDTLVSARTRRQEVLDRTDFELIAVVTLAPLLYQHGGPAVLKEQLRHVLTAMERPNVRVHVIPDNVSAGAYGGSMTVMHFADPADPSVAYLETAVTTEEHTQPQVTRRIVRLINHLQSAALDPPATRALIERRMDQLSDV